MSVFMVWLLGSFIGTVIGIVVGKFLAMGLIALYEWWEVRRFAKMVEKHRKNDNV